LMIKIIFFWSLLAVAVLSFGYFNSIIHGFGRRHNQRALIRLDFKSIHSLESSGTMQFAAGSNPLGYDIPSVVEVYSTLGCKYCRIAKAKLAELGVPYQNYDTQQLNIVEMKSHVVDRAKHAQSSTVPQIYVKGEHIGGCTELLGEVESGAFEARLKRYGIEKEDVVTSQPSVAATTSATHVMIDADQKYCPEESEPLNSIKFRSVTESNEGNRYQSDALGLSSALQRQALLLTDNFATADGKKVNYNAMRKSQAFADYLSLSSLLQDCSPQSLQSLTDREKLAFFANLYNAMIMHANCVITTNPVAIAAATAKDEALSSSSSHSSSKEEGEADALAKAIARRSAFYSGRSGAVYRIAGYDFSPDDLEHAILRTNLPHPSQVSAAKADFAASGRPSTAWSDVLSSLSFLPREDPRLVLAVARAAFDPRIHFILNCGAASCPPIKVLSPENVDMAFAAATSSYLASEVSVDAAAKIIHMPKLLLWYGMDFAPTLIGYLQKTAEQLPRTAPAKSQLTNLLDQAETSGSISFVSATDLASANQDTTGGLVYTVEYNNYDWTLNNDES